MRKNHKYFFLLCFLFSSILYGQQSPFEPFSYRIFTPEVFNPAITGSRDYTRVNFISGISRLNNSQILSGSTRLRNKGNRSLNLPDISRFSNLGMGGFIYHNTFDSLYDVGGALSASYNMKLGRDALSFLAFGVSVKGLYSKKTITPEPPDTTSNSFFSPDLDAGVYYYCPQFFIGISVTNILSFPSKPGFPVMMDNIISRQYLMTGGYRFVVSRTKSILIEPSLFLNFWETSSLDGSSNHFHPAVKVYYKGSYIGYYMNDPKDISLFMHLEFPVFFVGSYVEFPWNTNIPWRNNKLFIEVSAGINIGNSKNKVVKYW